MYSSVSYITVFIALRKITELQPVSS